MSRKGSGRSGYQGRGDRGGRVRGRSDREYNYSGYTNKHKGLCSYLSIHVFDYVQEDSADQMRTTREKRLHHVGTIYGHDIRNKLINKKIVTIYKP